MTRRPDSAEGLSGWADPSEPGWQDRVMAQVHANARRAPGKNSSGARGRRSAQITTYADIPFAGALKRAAAARGISVSAYVRRSIAIRVATDLGVDPREILVHCPPATPFDTKIGQFGWTERYDDGRGYGDWGWGESVDKPVDPD